jgi:hypothetical protein
MQSAGAGFARLEAGYRSAFVVEIRDNVEQAEHLQNHFHVAARAEELQVTAAIAKGDERTDDGADAGAIQLCGSSQVQQDFVFVAVDQLAKVSVQGVGGGADGGATLQIEDSNVAGVPDRDLEAHASPAQEKMSA